LEQVGPQEQLTDLMEVMALTQFLAVLHLQAAAVVLMEPQENLAALAAAAAMEMQQVEQEQALRDLEVAIL
jgi:hypothetical protein